MSSTPVQLTISSFRIDDVRSAIAQTVFANDREFERVVLMNTRSVMGFPRRVPNVTVGNTVTNLVFKGTPVVITFTPPPFEPMLD